MLYVVLETNGEKGNYLHAFPPLPVKSLLNSSFSDSRTETDISNFTFSFTSYSLITYAALAGIQYIAIAVDCLNPGVITSRRAQTTPFYHPSPTNAPFSVLSILSNEQHVMSMSEDDSRRMDEIRKYAAIYGRFDCKRNPEKPLTLHEVSTNCMHISWRKRMLQKLLIQIVAGNTG